jgi:hypothetical protein
MPLRLAILAYALSAACLCTLAADQQQAPNEPTGLPADADAKARSVDADEPVVEKARSAHLTGWITSPERVKSIEAVCRATGKAYEGAVKEQPGRFLFPEVPGDAVYDIRIRTPDGLRFEGVDLSFIDADLLRLARLRRKELGLPAEEPEELADADEAAILKYVAEQEDFLDTRRVLALRGDGRRATVLVELLRTRPFVLPSGKSPGRDVRIWRVDLWYFEKTGGGWRRLPETAQTVDRRVCTMEELKTTAVEYRPDWSVYVGRNGQIREVKLTVPEAVDDSLGRHGKTPTQANQKPTVLREDPVIPPGEPQPKAKQPEDSPDGKPEESNA